MYKCPHCTKPPFARAAELGRHQQYYKNGSCVRFFPYKRSAAAVNVPGSSQADPSSTDSEAAAAGCNPYSATEQTAFPEAGSLPSDDVDFSSLHLPNAAPQRSPQTDSARLFLRMVHGWANGAGMAAADLDNLLTFVHDPNIDITKLPKNVAEFKHYTNNFLQERDLGWETVQLDLGVLRDSDFPAGKPRFQVRFRKGLQWLLDYLQNPAFAGHFTAQATIQVVPGTDQQQWSLPSSGKAWVLAQQSLQQQHPGAIVLAVQLYSDKTLLTNKTSAYPVKFALLNVAHKQKAAHIVTIGFLPVVPKLSGMSPQSMQAFKQLVLTQSHDIMMSALRQASHTGVQLVTRPAAEGPTPAAAAAAAAAAGLAQATAAVPVVPATVPSSSSTQLPRLFPRLLSYVADNPEGRQLLQLYSANGCSMLCHRCYCLKQLLDNMFLVSKSRTISEQYGIQQEIAAATTPAEKLKKGTETSSQIATAWSGMMGWAGQLLFQADPHQIVRFEWMHVIELGWIPMLLAAIKQYADNRNMSGAALLATLDRELEQLPRFEGFYLPTGRTFFSAPSFVQARDYKAVMQVLPHLINGKVDAALTDIMCHAQQLFMAMYTRNEAPVYTEQSLNSIRSSTQQLINKIHTHMPDVNTLTPKVHALVHFPEDVTATGHPKHSNSDSWEKDHVRVKRAHKTGSRKKTNDQYLVWIIAKRQIIDALQYEESRQQASVQAARSSGAAASSSNRGMTLHELHAYVSVDEHELQDTSDGAGDSGSGAVNEAMLQAAAAAAAATAAAAVADSGAGSSSSASNSSLSLSGISSGVPTPAAVSAYSLAYMAARDTGQHQFSSTFKVCSLHLIQDAAASSSSSSSTLGADSTRVRGYHAMLPLLSRRLQDFLHDEAMAQQQAATGGSSSSRGRGSRPAVAPLPAGSDAIRVHKHAVLAAQYDWDTENCALETVRATDSFYHKPWFDSVAVRVTQQTGSIGSRQGVRTTTTTQYAQLLLLFQFRDPSWQQQVQRLERQLEQQRRQGLKTTAELQQLRAEVQRQQQQQGWRQLAYVKWYKAVARTGSDVLSKYGAKLLQEEMEKDPVLGTDVAKCTVIEVDTIINREYIVQDFSTPGRYHVSPFKHKS